MLKTKDPLPIEGGRGRGGLIRMGGEGEIIFPAKNLLLFVQAKINLGLGGMGGGGEG